MCSPVLVVVRAASQQIIAPGYCRAWCFQGFSFPFVSPPVPSNGLVLLRTVPCDSPVCHGELVRSCRVGGGWVGAWGRELAVCFPCGCWRSYSRDAFGRVYPRHTTPVSSLCTMCRAALCGHSTTIDGVGTSAQRQSQPWPKEERAKDETVAGTRRKPLGRGGGGVQSRSLSRPTE